MLMLKWIVPLVLLVGVIGFVVDREIWFHEGARLGPRIQGWLYNRWATKYDHNKRSSQSNDTQILAHPLLAALADQAISGGLMLDIATGTGRVPLALLQEPDFRGHIIALDLSDEMLRRARAKLSDHLGRIEFLRHSAFPLPFDADSFDIVSCVEALIIMPDLEQPLAEMARVLRPGGVLLTTHSLELYPSKRRTLTRNQFEEILHRMGFTDVRFEPWWEKFERVIALREGDYASPASSASLNALMHCPDCAQTAFNDQWTCQNCTHQLRVSEGIVLAPLTG